MNYFFVFLPWVAECTNGTFSCPEPDSTCINETLRCNFKPDCAVTAGYAADETEELCMVSQISGNSHSPLPSLPVYIYFSAPDPPLQFLKKK